ncbi:hypothetical protein [Lacipirellula parvula]|uniref:hypothetical protein n=1 Tax=Lacipirellula parvula TaxID=2650471 RepID=UPI001260A0E4|nr:hypothetical protein [Lacipirellula parvula]
MIIDNFNDNEVTGRPYGGRKTTHPLVLSVFNQRASLLKMESLELKVHYIPGHPQPMIRCNSDTSDGCSLCRAGYPALTRHLMIMCDWPDSRLCTLAVPGKLKDALFEEALCLPENEWNFLFNWNGFEYNLCHLDPEPGDEFVRTMEEHAQLVALAKLVDLDQAIPRLTNMAMLRLPAVMLAAACFGLDGEDQSEFNYTEKRAIQWRDPDEPQDTSDVAAFSEQGGMLLQLLGDVTLDHGGDQPERREFLELAHSWRDLEATLIVPCRDPAELSLRELTQRAQREMELLNVVCKDLLQFVARRLLPDSP